MPITPDMPETPDDDTAEPRKAGRNGTGRSTLSRAAARMAANDAPADDDTFDDRGDIYESDDEEELEEAPAGQGFSDMVREAPIGAVIGAFVAGFLISRLI